MVILVHYRREVFGIGKIRSSIIYNQEEIKEFIQNLFILLVINLILIVFEIANRLLIYSLNEFRM